MDDHPAIAGCLEVLSHRLDGAPVVFERGRPRVIWTADSRLRYLSNRTARARRVYQLRPTGESFERWQLRADLEAAERLQLRPGTAAPDPPRRNLEAEARDARAGASADLDPDEYRYPAGYRWAA